MTGRRWEVRVAGFACRIETGNRGDWVVTIASTTVSRRKDLAVAIVEAGGGLVSRSEAETVACSVRRFAGPDAVRGPVAQVVGPFLDGGDADRTLPGPPLRLGRMSTSSG